MSLADLISRDSSQTGTPTRGRTPIFQPKLAGETFDITISEAAFFLSEGQHDAGTLSVGSTTLTTSNGIVDKPISFFYGSSPRTELFSGYVTGVSEEKSSSGTLTFDMSVLGPTRPLQEGSPRFWTSRTIPNTVGALVNNAGLGFTSHVHDQIWPTLAQTEETDWKMSVDLARRLGWSIFNRHGIVGCFDPLKLYTESGAITRLISSNYDETGLDDGVERRLLEFSPQDVESTTGRSIGRRIALFLPNGQVQQVSQPGEFDDYRFVPNVVTRSTQEAETYMAAINSSVKDWDQQATARIFGSTNIYPGHCVDILTSNPRYYRDRFNGRWLVWAVQHKMDRNQFQTQLALARPSPSAPVFTGPYQPFWAQESRAKPSLSLIEGSWVSSWNDRRVATVV